MRAIFQTSVTIREDPRRRDLLLFPEWD